MNLTVLRYLFSGIAQMGAWICFECMYLNTLNLYLAYKNTLKILPKYFPIGFHRIDEQCLAIMAQQIMTIKDAKITRNKKVLFDGKEFKFNIHCGIFIALTLDEHMSGHICKLNI